MTKTPDEVLIGKKSIEEAKQLSSSIFPPFYDYQFSDEVLSVDDKNFIEKLIDAYQNAKIKPVIGKQELGGSDRQFDFSDDGSGKKSAFVIGLDFSF